ncbi:hypothetical protein MANES_17G087801v8 [Manihot esculenta]|uniref:Uncharacterized protein n=1 Tax=Manihot esculenta TaxID=3983 RepID=A0ACB7G3Y7_MANES|nr:hypothetical protein MANES_17G087801v8 [Manihot esculenta]
MANFQIAKDNSHFSLKFSAWRIHFFTISSHNSTMAFTKPTMLSLIFAAFIICFCFSSSLAELQRFQQPLKSDGSLSFLVIGDWGRRGLFNQSEVASQVLSCFSFSLLHSYMNSLLSCFYIHIYKFLRINFNFDFIVYQNYFYKYIYFLFFSIL